MDGLKSVTEAMNKLMYKSGDGNKSGNQPVDSEEKGAWIVSGAVLLSGLMVAASILVSAKSGATPTGSAPAVAPDAQTDPKVAEAKMKEILKKVGVDAAAVQQCAADQKFKDEIAKDMADGQAAGVSGTPSFVIGKLSADGKVTGELAVGALPVAEFKTVIDRYIAGVATPTGAKANPAATVSLDDDPVMGDRRKAKVAIVEFSDFECPFCQKFHKDSYDTLIKDYVDTGKAVISFRDYPLPFHEPKASIAAETAQCVKEAKGDAAYFQFSKLYFEGTQANGKGL